MAENKTEVIRLRVSPKDKERIKERAEEKGLTISEYIMRLIILDMEK